MPFRCPGLVPTGLDFAQDITFNNRRILSDRVGLGDNSTTIINRDKTHADYDDKH